MAVKKVGDKTPVVTPDEVMPLTGNNDKKFDVVLRSLQDLAQVQFQESEIKKQELVVRQKEIESNERIATKAIEAQSAAQTDKFQKYNRHLVDRYWFIGAILLMILLFCAYALSNDGKDLVLDALKMLLGFAAGIFGGFHWGQNKKQSGD